MVARPVAAIPVEVVALAVAPAVLSVLWDAGARILSWQNQPKEPVACVHECLGHRVLLAESITDDEVPASGPSGRMASANRQPIAQLARLWPSVLASG